MEANEIYPGTALSRQTIIHLKLLASHETLDDIGDKDETVYPSDVWGNHVDDAYMGGHSDGEASLARMILEEIEVDWQVEWEPTSD